MCFCVSACQEIRNLTSRLIIVGNGVSREVKQAEVSVSVEGSWFLLSDQNTLFCLRRESFLIEDLFNITSQ